MLRHDRLTSAGHGTVALTNDPFHAGVPTGRALHPFDILVVDVEAIEHLLLDKLGHLLGSLDWVLGDVGVCACMSYCSAPFTRLTRRTGFAKRSDHERNALGMVLFKDGNLCRLGQVHPHLGEIEGSCGSVEGQDKPVPARELRRGRRLVHPFCTSQPPWTPASSSAAKKGTYCLRT